MTFHSLWVYHWSLFEITVWLLLGTFLEACVWFLCFAKLVKLDFLLYSVIQVVCTVKNLKGSLLQMCTWVNIKNSTHKRFDSCHLLYLNVTWISAHVQPHSRQLLVLWPIKLSQTFLPLKITSLKCIVFFRHFVFMLSKLQLNTWILLVVFKILISKMYCITKVLCFIWGGFLKENFSASHCNYIAISLATLFF